MRAEDALLDDIAREKLGRIRDGVEIRRDLLLREPLALRRRLLRLWIAELRGDFRAIDYAHMAELLRLSESGPPQFRCPIGNGWELLCEYQRLRLVKGRKKNPTHWYSYSLRVGETLHIPEARLQILSEASGRREMLMPGSLTEAVFDAALLTAPLEVRNFRTGDRLQPFGMRGHKKVKEIFIDAKVPARWRAVLPLLTMAGEILWIPGYARSSIAKVTARTTSLICFKSVSQRV
jgi:tRNA(Ile)-lysidine synthase